MKENNVTGTWSSQGLFLDLGEDLGKMHLTFKENKKLAGLPIFVGATGLVGVKKAPKTDFKRVIYLELPENLEEDYLLRYLENLLNQEKKALPAPQETTFSDYFAKLAPLFKAMELELTPAMPEKIEKNRPAKAPHRFSKEVSTIPFYVDYEGAKAEVYWQKRNEMCIKKGAQMKAQPHLNADGTTGFGVRFAEQIRQEHQGAFNADFITTEDIILKSVNEVGHFLYFANTNSWLQLKDTNGKTLDEWTVVK